MERWATPSSTCFICVVCNISHAFGPSKQITKNPHGHLYHHIFHHSTVDTMHKNTFQVSLDGKQVTPPKMVSSVAKAPCVAPWQKVATSLPLPAYCMASPFCAGHIERSSRCWRGDFQGHAGRPCPAFRQNVRADPRKRAAQATSFGSKMGWMSSFWWFGEVS